MSGLVTSLWQHQRSAVDFARARKGSVCTLAMGGGKSAVAVGVAAEDEATTVLILCPVSVRGVWRREFQRHAPGAFEVLCLDDGTVKDKAAATARHLELMKARRQRAVIVVNYESAWREPLAACLMRRTWDLLILDESHRVKAPQGKASRFVAKLAKLCRRRLALTGTPAPHSPLDIYAQARAVDTSVFGTSFTAFRGRYAEVNAMFPSQVRRWLNQEELRERWRRIAYEHDLTGLLDVPDATDQTVTVELGPKARRIYRDLERDFYAKIDKGEITVANAMVNLLRLGQLTGGHVRLDESEALVEVDDAKRRALADVAEDVATDVPIVVFCRFVADLDSVRAVAATAGRTYGEISGRTKDALDDRACLRAGVGMVGVQIQSGGVGIDLTAAGIGVWFSVGFSLGDYLQARARLVRPGQKRHVAFIHLVAEQTVDETVLRALERRQEVVDAVLHGRARPSDSMAVAA